MRAARERPVPFLKPENLERLDRALNDLGVTDPKGMEGLRQNRELSVATPHGDLDLTPEPPGSAGYQDLRRAAERQPLGRGLRPAVASAPDLVRTVTDAHDPAIVTRLRRLLELERSIAPEM